MIPIMPRNASHKEVLKNYRDLPILVLYAGLAQLLERFLAMEEARS